MRGEQAVARERARPGRGPPQRPCLNCQHGCYDSDESSIVVRTLRSSSVHISACQTLHIYLWCKSASSPALRLLCFLRSLCFPPFPRFPPLPPPPWPADSTVQQHVVFLFPSSLSVSALSFTSAHLLHRSRRTTTNCTAVVHHAKKNLYHYFGPTHFSRFSKCGPVGSFVRLVAALP